METNDIIITRTAVESSNIKSVGYDADTQTLEVEFTNGGVYRYADVPAETHAGMVAAESAGRYFAAHVRNAFKAEKVLPEKRTDSETINALLEGLYESEQARTDWLWSPQVVLNGGVPIKLIADDRSAEVVAALRRACDGAFL